jgi:hypothetical protein
VVEGLTCCVALISGRSSMRIMVLGSSGRRRTRRSKIASCHTTDTGPNHVNATSLVRQRPGARKPSLVTM